MVLDDRSSKLVQHGFHFRNWAGPGEAASDHFGLSHVVIVPATADRMIVSGQLGIRDDDTVSSNLQEEIDEAFDHVEKSLKAAGLGDDAWEHIYKACIDPVASLTGLLILAP